MRLALTLLRLGHRCGRGARGDGLVHRLAVTLGAATALLTVWLFVVCGAVYQQRDARIAARSPDFVATGGAAAAVAWWREGTDTAYRHQFSVITLVPLREGAPPPPGLPGWPQPGQVYLSPRLAALDEGGELHRRYGTVAGLIGVDGLADPGELLVYRRPAGVDLPAADPAQGTVAVRGFGTGDPYRLANQATDAPLSWAAKALLILVLPAGAMLVIAVRTGSQRRDARLAMLDALGAPMRARAWVVLGEAAVPAVLGVGLGAAAALLSTLTDVTLPFSGYRIRAADLAHTRGGLARAAVPVLLAVLALTVAMQIGRRRRTGNRPTAVAASARRWPVAVFAAAVAVAALGALLRGNTGRVLYALGMLVALAAAPVVGGLLTGLLGRAVAALGGRAGSPRAIVGGRWLAARSSVIGRTGAVFVIGLGLASQAQVTQSQLTAVGAAGSRLHQVVGDSMIELHASPVFADELPRFAATLDQRRVLRIYHEELPQSPNGAQFERRVRTVVVGTPGALAALGDVAVMPAAPVPVNRAYRALGRDWWRLLTIGVLETGAILPSDAMKYPERLLISTAAPATGTLDAAVVLNAGGAAGVESVKRSAYATLVAPNVRVSADDFLAAAYSYASLVGWLLDAGLAAMVMLILAGAMASAGFFVAQARELGPLAGYHAGRRLYQGISAWTLTVPLIAVSAAGTVTAAGLALLLTRLTPYGEFSVPFLLLCLAMAAVAAVAVGAGCGEVATRATRDWRPAGE